MWGGGIRGQKGDQMGSGRQEKQRTGHVRLSGKARVRVRASPLNPGVN